MTTATVNPQGLSIRDAVRYLERTHSLDLSEMRMRTLIREHPIFVEGPEPKPEKVKSGDMEKWAIPTGRLDAYAAAVRSGAMRAGGSGGGVRAGGKVYKIRLDESQLAKMRTWCEQNGVEEPVAQTYYNKKSKAKKAALAAANGAAGTDLGLDDDDEDDEDLEDLLDSDDDE